MQEFFNKAVDLCTQAGGKVILALVVFIYRGPNHYR